MTKFGSANMVDWQDISTWCVLVVDDEPDNLEVLAETLEFKGALVQTAMNGQKGLDTLMDFAATLVLTDLSMPVMNGWQMRTQIKSNPNTSQIPIVALSAHAIAGDKERALEAGFDGYLTKPINIHTLLDDIRSELGKSLNVIREITAT
jgi:CheY-like chemotaxis protein